jgi:hypothetical protein
LEKVKKADFGKFADLEKKDIPKINRIIDNLRGDHNSLLGSGKSWVDYTEADWKKMIDFDNDYQKYISILSMLKHREVQKAKSVVPVLKMHSYNKKMVISGSVIEVYNYSTNFVKGGSLAQNLGTSELKENNDLNDYISDELKAERNLQNSRSRSKRNFIRLVNANAENLTKFYTFTFDASKLKDKSQAKDLTFCNKQFCNFIKRFKRFLTSWFGQETADNLKYLCGIEFQDNGNVHYHVLFDVPYICNIPEKLTLAEISYIKKRYGEEAKGGLIDLIWGLGSVKLNKIDSVDNVGLYTSKYMSKSFEDDRFFGRCVYLRSNNLKEPVEIIDSSEIEKFLNECNNDTLVSDRSFSNYSFEVRKRVYNLRYSNIEKGVFTQSVDLSLFDTNGAVYDVLSRSFYNKTTGIELSINPLSVIDKVLKNGFVPDSCNFLDDIGLMTMKSMEFDFKEVEDLYEFQEEHLEFPYPFEE